MFSDYTHLPNQLPLHQNQQIKKLDSQHKTNHEFIFTNIHDFLPKNNIISKKTHSDFDSQMTLSRYLDKGSFDSTSDKMSKLKKEVVPPPANSSCDRSPSTQHNLFSLNKLSLKKANDIICALIHNEDKKVIHNHFIVIYDNTILHIERNPTHQIYVIPGLHKSYHFTLGDNSFGILKKLCKRFNYPIKNIHANENFGTKIHEWHNENLFVQNNLINGGLKKMLTDIIEDESISLMPDSNVLGRKVMSVNLGWTFSN